MLEQLYPYVAAAELILSVVVVIGIVVGMTDCAPRKVVEQSPTALVYLRIARESLHGINIDMDTCSPDDNRPNHVQKGLHKLDCKRHHYEQIFDECDLNHNRLISRKEFEEFVAHAHRKHGADKEHPSVSVDCVRVKQIRHHISIT